MHKRQRFSFDKTFRDAWLVTRIEIRVLKRFYSFEIRSHVKNRFLVEYVTKGTDSWLSVWKKKSKIVGKV